MRLSVLLLLAALTSAPAAAQLQPTIGPAFPESGVRRENFDVAFEVKVTLVPASPVLLGQTREARYDGVVCNTEKSGEGWVKVNSEARWGVLKGGTCTMFANFDQLDLAPVDVDHLWTAKVYLRARR
jgi:hypothetical protein